MYRYLSSLIFISFISLFLAFNFFCQGEREKANMKISDSEFIELPQPNFSGEVSIEKALYKRRSIRDYTDAPLTISEIAQLLWAAQGITEKSYGLRTAPSAGALYPLEIYIVVSNVTDLAPGIFKYQPQNHTLKKISNGDKRRDISNAALRQDAIESSAAVILITAVYERTAVKYGGRAERYVNIEVGAAAQNIYLQSVSLEIGTVIIGAFKDDSLKKTLNLPANERPLAIMPLGKI
jgi:SagB-type dehydrogenase family enzyme